MFGILLGEKSRGPCTRDTAWREEQGTMYSRYCLERRAGDHVLERRQVTRRYTGSKCPLQVIFS